MKYGKNAGYEIVAKAKISENHYIVVGYNEKAVEPFVTWEYAPKEDSYFWGHYFTKETDAYIDLGMRIEKLSL